MRTREPLTISLPREMTIAVRKASKREHRTTSELVREALRRYLDGIPVVRVSPEELDAIQRGREELRRGESVALAEIRSDLDGGARTASRAKSRGSRPIG
ncbi:MAG: ribbon-helix-helix protein, CopG family [Gemmatimonadaceae bacterium]